MEKLSIHSTVTLANGVKMPLLGYSAEETAHDPITQKEIFHDAIEVGFRYFDTADACGSHRALGAAIRESGIPREDFFIASKAYIDDIRDRKLYWCFEETLAQLELETLDLYSQHWAFTERQFAAWWKLEQLYDEKRVRAIGVCNHEPEHIERIKRNEYAKYLPMVNQSHFHPQHTAGALRQYCADNNIVFGGLFEKDELYVETKPRYFVEMTRFGELFDEGENPNDITKNPRRERDHYDDVPQMQAIAQAHGKTCTQVWIRWSLQHGVVTTPKTKWRHRMEEFIDVFDFELSEDEMAAIDALNYDHRIGYHPSYIDF